jgi:hypothetical protein
MTTKPRFRTLLRSLFATYRSYGQGRVRSALHALWTVLTGRI